MSRALLRQRGQELLEFAIVLPILLLVILGALATANAVSSDTQINQAAARAALDASNANTTHCADAFTAAQTAIQEVVTSNIITVDAITVDCNAGDHGNHATCFGTETGSPNSDCSSAAFEPGNLLTVVVDTHVSVALFGTGPSLPLSSTGASVIPPTP